MLLLLLIPLLSSLLLAFVTKLRISSLINIAASLLTFLVSVFLALRIYHEGHVQLGNGFYADYLSAFLLVTTTGIGFTTALFSRNYLFNEQRTRHLARKNSRFYHSLYQFFFFAAILILLTNNLGILWVAMECATLSTVLLIGLYHIPFSLEAAWKYLVLCGLGLAQALLGTILLYFAGEHLLSSSHALLWTDLRAVSTQLSPHMARLAFVFILVGYGTKAGFVPLHNWLPDVYAEGIPPVLSLLSGVLLNMAFYAILRCKLIVDGAVGPEFTQYFLLGFGLLNILIAAFFLLRQREIKRVLAYSSIEHIGIISFAFGLGTPLANLAGLLHMVAHSFTKSAAFFSAGLAMQIRQTVAIDKLRGLIQTHPRLGWGFLLCILALLGLPPSPLFISEFLILYTTVQQHLLLTLPLVIGMLIAFGAILHHVQQMVFSQDDSVYDTKNIRLNLTPIYLHLILIAAFGISIAMMIALAR